MRKCKHENVFFVEVIESYHQRVFDNQGYYKNNEYGGRIKIEVNCNDCNIKKNINLKNKDNQPKWISDKIELMKVNNDWFFE